MQNCGMPLCISECAARKARRRAAKKKGPGEGALLRLDLGVRGLDPEGRRGARGGEAEEQEEGGGDPVEEALELGNRERHGDTHLSV